MWLVSHKHFFVNYHPFLFLFFFFWVTNFTWLVVVVYIFPVLNLIINTFKLNPSKITPTWKHFDFNVHYIDFFFKSKHYSLVFWFLKTLKKSIWIFLFGWQKRAFVLLEIKAGNKSFLTTVILAMIFFKIHICFHYWLDFARCRNQQMLFKLEWVKFSEYCLLDATELRELHIVSRLYYSFTFENLFYFNLW